MKSSCSQNASFTRGDLIQPHFPVNSLESRILTTGLIELYRYCYAIRTAGHLNFTQLPVIHGSILYRRVFDLRAVFNHHYVQIDCSVFEWVLKPKYGSTNFHKRSRKARLKNRGLKRKSDLVAQTVHRTSGFRQRDTFRTSNKKLIALLSRCLDSQRLSAGRWTNKWYSFYCQTFNDHMPHSSDWILYYPSSFFNIAFPSCFFHGSSTAPVAAAAAAAAVCRINFESQSHGLDARLPRLPDAALHVMRTRTIRRQRNN